MSNAPKENEILEKYRLKFGGIRSDLGYLLTIKKNKDHWIVTKWLNEKKEHEAYYNFQGELFEHKHF